MQTFLPHPCFTVSAVQLDWQRLGKQRVEAHQILMTLRGFYKTGGWSNHPATKMWAGFEDALVLYRDVCVREWVRRGYENTMPLLLGDDLSPAVVAHIRMPGWLGCPDFHASHRAALLHKNQEWYSRHGWREEPRLAYIWPAPS